MCYAAGVSKWSAGFPRESSVHPALVCLLREQDDVFVFQMDKLSVYLKQFLQNQSTHVQFCNLPVLKYDVSSKGLSVYGISSFLLSIYR